MTAHTPVPASVESSSADADYSRAMLNILGDFTEERAQLRGTQQAVLNILNDFADEKLHLGLTQRAMQNILEDAGAEREHLRAAQRGFLNILDDFDGETKKLHHAEAEIRRINTDLEHHLTQLEGVNRDLESFSYSVSHDLRAPLRAIDGFSRILLEDYADSLDAEGQRVLNVVRDSTLKMAHLIDDILAFSRAGRIEMNPVPVDMAAMVRMILADALAPALAGRALTIDIGKLPPARGDRAMFERVWTNLLDNAIKFTAPKPTARIEIAATPDARETVYYVRDDGVGFDMQYAGKLFGVFQRLHGAEVPGTGIGLAIVKRLVTRHGGRVWGEGRVGEGATLYFALPTQEETDG
jgi:light-regulated signal transduction histidine kinase (bacteriophytochrome)